MLKKTNAMVTIFLVNFSVNAEPCFFKYYNKTDTNALVMQEANCIVIDKIKKRGSKAITQAMIDDCQLFSKTNFKKWREVPSEVSGIILLEDSEKSIVKENLDSKHKPLLVTNQLIYCE